MAGKFAKSVNATQLVITHFGGEIASDEYFIEEAMVEQAKEAFGSCNVVAAKDFLVIDVPRRTQDDESETH
jgi:ribonuclease BN (tRNA processing enzyme)